MADTDELWHDTQPKKLDPLVMVPRADLLAIREAGANLLRAIDLQLDLEPFEGPLKSALTTIEGLLK